MRAAGRTLTVGELREALHGLRDDDPVRVVALDRDEVGVEAVDGGRVDLRLVVPALPRDTDLDEDVFEVLDEVLRVRTLPRELKDDVRRLLTAYARG